MLVFLYSSFQIINIRKNQLIYKFFKVIFLLSKKSASKNADLTKDMFFITTQSILLTTKDGPCNDLIKTDPNNLACEKGKRWGCQR
jgi:hypothetical protein